MSKNKNINKFTLWIIAFAFPLFAEAGVGSSLMQGAEILRPNEYELKLHTDIIFNSGGGLNVVPHLRKGIIEHILDVSAYFGTGKTDFQFGAKAKYNLLPDIEGQIGVSFLGGIGYIHDNEKSFGLFSLGVVASKKFDTDFGHLTPYGGFEPEWLYRSKNSTFPMSLLLGARWAIHQTAPWIFYSELGVSIKNSHYYLGLGAGYPF